MHHHGRAEKVETKPLVRDAFKRTRCLIPVSGYYEWRDHSLPAEETVTDVEGWEFNTDRRPPLLSLIRRSQGGGTSTS